MPVKLENLGTHEALAALEELYPADRPQPGPYTKAQTTIHEALDSALRVNYGFHWLERFAQGGIRLFMWQDLLLVAMALLGVVQVVVGSDVLLSPGPSSIRASHPSLPLFAGVGLAIIATLIANLGYQFRQRARLAVEIPRSNLATIVTAGPDEINRVIEDMPFPWKLMFLRPARNLREGLKLLLGNVEWYLKPRRPYVNPTWILYLAGLGLVMGNLILVIVSFNYFNFITSGQPIPPAVQFLNDNYMVGSGVSALGLQLFFAGQSRDTNFRRLAAEHLRNVFLSRD